MDTINLLDYNVEKLDKFQLIQNMLKDNITELILEKDGIKIFNILYEEENLYNYNLPTLIKVAKLADYLQYKNMEYICKILAEELKSLTTEQLMELSGNKLEDIEEIKKRNNI